MYTPFGALTNTLPAILAPPATVRELVGESEMLVRGVNTPGAGMVLPMDPGAAQVEPCSREALRLVTWVLEATVKGAIPKAVVLLRVCAVTTVKAPVLGVLLPIVPGDSQVLPCSVAASPLMLPLMVPPTHRSLLMLTPPRV